MAIKASSLSVIVAAFLVAGTLLWIGVIEEGTPTITTSPLNNSSLNKPPTIKVGWIGPLSGNNSAIGESMKRGAELADGDLNIDTIETTFIDVQCNVEEAIKAVNKLLIEHKAQAIINAACSTVGLAINPIAQQARVVTISPNNTTSQFTDTGDYVYRTVSGALNFGKFAAQVVNNEKITSVVVLHSNDEASSNYQKMLLQHLQASAMTTASESFSPDATDFSVQLANIKKINPDGIFIITNSETSVLSAIEQINRASITAKIFGSPIFSNQSLLSKINAFPKKFLVISSSRGSDEFIARFKEIYNESPKLFAAQSYDAFIAIARSIEDGADNGPLIRDRLKTIQFEGASGYIQFNEKREIQNNWQIYSVENGLLTLKKQKPILKTSPSNPDSP